MAMINNYFKIATKIQKNKKGKQTIVLEGDLIFDLQTVIFFGTSI